jgi:hypothetical protein
MGFAMAALGGLAVAEEPATNPRVQKLSVLLKSKVMIQDDQPAGQVVDVVFNEGGCLDYVVVSHEKQFYAIPYSAVSMRYDDQVVFVDVAPAQFRKVQFFSNNSWPDFYAADFRQQTFSTFSVRSIRTAGEGSTSRRDADRNGDRNNVNPRDNRNKPRVGRTNPRGEPGDTTPGIKPEGSEPPVGDNSVTPRTARKPIQPNRGETPDSATDRPEANPYAPAAKPPLSRTPNAPKTRARPSTPAVPKSPSAPMAPKTPQLCVLAW